MEDDLLKAMKELEELGLDFSPYSLLSIERVEPPYLRLSTRTRNLLLDAGIKMAGELAAKSEWELRAIRGLGKKSLEEIKDALAEYGYDLKN